MREWRQRKVYSFLRPQNPVWEWVQTLEFILVTLIILCFLHLEVEPCRLLLSKKKEEGHKEMTKKEKPWNFPQVK